MPFESGMQIRGPVAKTTADLDLFKAIGCEWTRLGFDMAFVCQNGNVSNPIAGWNPNPGGTGDLINYAHSIGLKVFAPVTYCPSWLGLYHQIPQTSQLQDAWAFVAASLVDYYPDVDVWELWNEPNNEPFNFEPAMASIRAFFKKCITAMRFADSTVKIHAGHASSGGSRVGQWTTRWDTGTWPGTSPPGGGGNISPATYLDGLFGPPGVATDGSGIVGGTTPGTAYVDGYGIHGYTGGIQPDYNAFENPLYHSFRDMPNIGDPAVFGAGGFNYYDDIVQVRDPGTTKTIWSGEGGFYGGHPDMPESTAANHMTIALAMWRQKQEEGKAGPYIYFELRDMLPYVEPWNPAVTYQTNWGVTDSTGEFWRALQPNRNQPPQAGPYWAEYVPNWEDYLGLYRKNLNGLYTPKIQQGVWTAFTTEPGPDPDPDPDPGPPDVDFGDCPPVRWGDDEIGWGDLRSTWYGVRTDCEEEVEPLGLCSISMMLEIGDEVVVFNCETADAAGNFWVWQKLDGWWDPPEQIHSTIKLGRHYGELVTHTRWAPRSITLRAAVDTRDGDINAARDTLTVLSSSLKVPGRLTVDDGVQPRYADVILADRPRHELLSFFGLEAEFPLVAYDVRRRLLSTGTGGV